MKYNDIDMSKWKEYNDIKTDSLWIIEKRDNSGAHSGHYHGNFIPQIPHQLFSRYTKKGDKRHHMSAGSVKMNLYRNRKKLLKLLEKEGGRI